MRKTAIRLFPPWTEYNHWPHFDFRSDEDHPFQGHKDCLVFPDITLLGWTAEGGGQTAWYHHVAEEELRVTVVRSCSTLHETPNLSVRQAILSQPKNIYSELN